METGSEAVGVGSLDSEAETDEGTEAEKDWVDVAEGTTDVLVETVAEDETAILVQPAGTELADASSWRLVIELWLRKYEGYSISRLLLVTPTWTAGVLVLWLKTFSTLG